MSFIGAGPIPPNPAELILSLKTKQLFEELRNRFDAIIVDTAPLGLVADSLLLADHIDRTIVVTRYGITEKELLKAIEETYHNKKLPKMGDYPERCKERPWGMDTGMDTGTGTGTGTDITMKIKRRRKAGNSGSAKAFIRIQNILL
jgi:tyrosine-protein kinase Etk/Wzc